MTQARPAWFTANMTEDVVATFEWLLAAEFVVTDEQYGTMQSGHVRFDRPDMTVLVVSDRGQWMLDLEVGGERFDLDAVVDTRAGRNEWRHQSGPLPSQLPIRTSWRDELPTCIDWMLSHPTALDEIRVTQHRRADALFPKPSSTTEL